MNDIMKKLDEFLNENIHRGSDNEIRQLINKENINAMVGHLNDVEVRIDSLSDLSLGATKRIASIQKQLDEIRDFLNKLYRNADTIALQIGDRLK